MKMEPTVSTETSAIRNQAPGNYPKRNKLHLYTQLDGGPVGPKQAALIYWRLQINKIKFTHIIFKYSSKFSVLQDPTCLEKHVHPRSFQNYNTTQDTLLCDY